MRFLNRFQPFALLVLRLALGSIMIAHGWPKVFQGGIGRTVMTMTSWGWPWWLGYVAGYTELVGGALLIPGVLVRLWGLAFAFEMIVVIWKIHWARGFTGPGAAEFPLACAAIAFALIFFGGGLLSVDHLIWGRGHKSGR